MENAPVVASASTGATVITPCDCTITPACANAPVAATTHNAAQAVRSRLGSRARTSITLSPVFFAVEAWLGTVFEVLQYSLARQLTRCDVAITVTQPRHDPPLHPIISRLHLKQLRPLIALGEHGLL